MRNRNGSVPKGFIVEYTACETVRCKPKERGGEPYQIFEITSLCLKVMWAEMHPLRPHNSGRISHCDISRSKQSMKATISNSTVQAFSGVLQRLSPQYTYFDSSREASYL